MEKSKDHNGSLSLRKTVDEYLSLGKTKLDRENSVLGYDKVIQHGVPQGLCLKYSCL